VTWLVAVSEYARQPQAIQALAELDFLTYNPQFKARMIRAGRKIVTLRSLFGRYFFVRMCDRWRSVIHVRGVYDVMMQSEEETPLLVRDDAIAEIKSREIGGLVLVENCCHFRQGQLVTPKTVDHFLYGKDGKFLKTAQRDREVALFDILGHETKVEFEPGILIARSGDQENAKRKRAGRRHRAIDRQRVIAH
jgi:transcription antitermination factor NusG